MRLNKLMDKKARILGIDVNYRDYINQSKNKKWSAISWNSIGYTNLTNAQLISNTYSLLRSSRIKDSLRINKHNMLRWYRLYPGINVKSLLFDDNGLLLDQCIDGRSLIWKLESRLDVLLWRSGFAHTIQLAQKIIVSGKVSVFADNLDLNIKQPGYCLIPGNIVKVDEVYYTSLLKIGIIEGISTKIVYLSPYISVNYMDGVRSFNRYPIDGEFMLPFGVYLSMKTRITSKN